MRSSLLIVSTSYQIVNNNNKRITPGLQQQASKIHSPDTERLCCKQPALIYTLSTFCAKWISEYEAPVTMPTCGAEGHSSQKGRQSSFQLSVSSFCLYAMWQCWLHHCWQSWQTCHTKPLSSEINLITSADKGWSDYFTKDSPPPVTSLLAGLLSSHVTPWPHMKVSRRTSLNALTKPVCLSLCPYSQS